jgi:hypothetical protein
VEKGIQKPTHQLDIRDVHLLERIFKCDHPVAVRSILALVALAESIHVSAAALMLCRSYRSCRSISCISSHSHRDTVHFFRPFEPYFLFPAPLGQILDHGCRPGAGVSQDTGPQSNELRQAASYLGRFRFRASALVRTLRRPRTSSLNIRLALIQGAALQAARERLKRYARVVLSGPGIELAEPMNYFRSSSLKRSVQLDLAASI